MPLLSKSRQALKAKAHKLNPIVIVGNGGLTENVNMEIARGLFDHELIKIRFPALEKAQKKALLTQVCEHHQAELVQLVGNIGVIYKRSDKPKKASL